MKPPARHRARWSRALRQRMPGYVLLSISFAAGVVPRDVRPRQAFNVAISMYMFIFCIALYPRLWYALPSFVDHSNMFHQNDRNTKGAKGLVRPRRQRGCAHIPTKMVNGDHRTKTTGAARRRPAPHPPP